MGSIDMNTKALAPELEEFLRSNRDELNQLYRLEWLQNRNLDGAAFLQSFESLATSYLNANHTAGSADRKPGLMGLYRMLLLAQPSRSWNSRMEKLLESALNLYPAVASDQGQLFLSRIYNAAHSLSQHGLDPQRWWLLMKKLAGANVDYTGENANRFYRLAAALSYLAGMIHLRSSALIELQNMNEEEAKAIFPRVQPKELRTWISHLKRDPWAGLSSPEPFITGGYQGFSSFNTPGGGTFFRPPEFLRVEEESQAILLTDSHRNYLLFADRFGSQIIPRPITDEEQKESERPDAVPEDLLKVALKSIKKYALPEPSGISAILHRKTVICLSEDSHFVWVVPVH